MGRPEIYSDELADKICTQIAETSNSLRTICKGEDMPSVGTVLKWLRTNDSFLAQYARAKEEQADFLAEEMMEIADDASKDLEGYNEYGKPIENKEFVNRSKLRVETRKWIASKLKPKKYGDKLDVTSKDEQVGAAVVIQGQKFADENNH